MQIPTPQMPASWLASAIHDLVLVLTGGTFATLGTLYFTRKKTSAETDKIKAETQHLALTDELSAAEMMRDTLRELNQAQRNITQLSAKAARADAQELEIKMLHKQLDEYTSTERQVERLRDGTTSGEHLR